MIVSQGQNLIRFLLVFNIMVWTWPSTDDIHIKTNYNRVILSREWEKHLKLWVKTPENGF